jgi:hypothetical protein
MFSPERILGRWEEDCLLHTLSSFQIGANGAAVLLIDHTPFK